MVLRCRHLVLAFALCGLLAACGSGAGSDSGTGAASEPGTGVEGVVTLSGACPDAQDAVCPDRPFVATVDVRDESGRQVQSVRSDEDGRFRVDLDPGAYTLVPVVAESGAPPTAAPQSVEVVAGRYTSVRISYDSGVR